MMPSRLFVVGFSLSLAALVQRCEGQQGVVEDLRRREREWAEKPRLPSVENIVQMTAECYGHPSSPFFKDVGAFEVPQERYTDVLRRFVDAELDPQPRQEDTELGTVRMSFSGGRTWRIIWFWTGRETRLHFSYDGLRYIATGERLADDEALGLDSFFRTIAAGSKAKASPLVDAKQTTARGAPALPALEEIEAISAEAYSHVLSPIVKDMPSFDVPEERFAEVLLAFRKKSVPYERLRNGTELGSLRLTLKGGRTRRICWFWMGHKGRMVFSYSGMRYKTVDTTFETDETLEYDGRIRIMKQEIDAAEEARK